MAALGAPREDDVGIAAGATNLLQELGGAVGVAITVAAFLSVVGLLGAGVLPRRAR